VKSWSDETCVNWNPSEGLMLCGEPEMKVEPSRRHQPGEEDVARAPAP